VNKAMPGEPLRLGSACAVRFCAAVRLDCWSAADQGARRPAPPIMPREAERRSPLPGQLLTDVFTPTAQAPRFVWAMASTAPLSVHQPVSAPIQRLVWFRVATSSDASTVPK